MNNNILPIQYDNLDDLDFSKLVYINTTDPATATIFDLNSPPSVNDPSLKNDSANVYVGTDGKTYTWNGTAYVTYNPSSTTEWNIGGTTTDAKGDKINAISRTGFVAIGKNVNTAVPIDVYGKGTAQYSVVARFTNPDNIVAGNNTQMVFGAQQASGNCSDWRFFYAGNGSAANRIDFGMSGRVAPMISYNFAGNVGVNTTAPGSNLDVAGSFGFNIRGAGSSTSQTDGDGTVVFTVIGAVYTLLAPVAAHNRRMIAVKNQTTGNITVNGHIDGVAGVALTIPAKASRIFHSNGTSWWIIGGYL